MFAFFNRCPWNNRLDRMEKWHQQGGVLIIGYTMFRLLYEAIDKLNGNKISKEKKDVVKAFQKCLIDPGADLVVCDEGHLLKNHNSKLNAAVNKIRTLRRIVLTVTPLQNNLSECKHVYVCRFCRILRLKEIKCTNYL